LPSWRVRKLEQSGLKVSNGRLSRPRTMQRRKSQACIVRSGGGSDAAGASGPRRTEQARALARTLARAASPTWPCRSGRRLCEWLISPMIAVAHRLGEAALSALRLSSGNRGHDARAARQRRRAASADYFRLLRRPLKLGALSVRLSVSGCEIGSPVLFLKSLPPAAMISDCRDGCEAKGRQADDPGGKCLSFRHRRGKGGGRPPALRERSPK